MLRVVSRELPGIRGGTLCLGQVTLLLDTGKHGERYVHHVGAGPYLLAVSERILVVHAGCGKFQGYLVLVVVGLVVATQPYEYSHLVIGERRGVLLHRIGMHEHLQTAILTQVEGRILVNGLGLVGAEVGYHHVEGLLIGLDQLGLCGVLRPGYARRQHVVDGGLVVVLLYINRAHCHLARSRSRRVE